MLTREHHTSTSALLSAFTQLNLSDQHNSVRVMTPAVQTRYGVHTYPSLVYEEDQADIVNLILFMSM